MNPRIICAVAIALGPAIGEFSNVDLVNAEPIQIAEVAHDGPVDFEKEVLPLLRRNCIACHNATKKENSLILENPKAILEGGDSGPAAEPGMGSESMLVQLAAHQSDPAMPPKDNTVGAKNFSPEELGLIKRWIDEGAKGEVKGGNGPIKWQPLPPGINPIYAVSMTSDGQIAACGRANQIFVYHLPSAALITRLTDPALLSSGLYKQSGVAHYDLVQSLAFSPDGELLASGSYREIKLWRRAHPTPTATLKDAPVNVVATSVDGLWGALGLKSGVIQLWDVAGGKPAAKLEGHSGEITSLAFVTNGKQLLSTSFDKSARIWDLAQSVQVGRIETPAAVTSAALLADGSHLATGGADNLVRIWKLPEAPAALQTLTGHTQPVTAVAAVPGAADQVLSASADGTIRRWNIQNGQQQQQVDHGGPVAAMAVRPDGQQVASAGASGVIRLWKGDLQPWQAPNNQPIPEMKGDHRAQLRLARAEREVAGLVARVAERKKEVTDAEAKVTATAEAVKTAMTAKETAAKNAVDKVAAAKAPVEAKAAADKETEAAMAALKAAEDAAAAAKDAAEKDAQNQDLAKARDEANKALEAAKQKKQEAEKKSKDLTEPANKAMQEASTAESGAVAADQAFTTAMDVAAKAVEAVPLAKAVLERSEKTLVDAQAEAAAATAAVTESEKPIRSLAYSADGLQLASAGENKLVRTWSSVTGQPTETYAAHTGAVQSVAFAGKGALVSSDAATDAIVWQSQPEWKLERTIGSVEDGTTFIDRVLALSFSPDGKLLAAGGGEPSRSGELKIFNVADGQLVRAIADAHSDTIFGVSFSPDGSHLASCGADRFVKVFDAAGGALARSFEGHTHHVLGVAWRADGKVIASAGADNVIKIWDFTTGDQKLTTQPLGKEATSVSFIGDSPRVMVTSGDKSVRLYNTDNGGNERNYDGGQDFMYALSISVDGKVAIGGGQDSVLKVWNVENTQVLNKFEPPKVEGNDQATPAGDKQAGN